MKFSKKPLLGAFPIWKQMFWNFKMCWMMLFLWAPYKPAWLLKKIKLFWFSTRPKWSPTILRTTTCHPQDNHPPSPWKSQRSPGRSHTILRTVTHHPWDDLKNEDNLNDEDDLNNKGDLNNEDIPQMDKCRRVYRILPKKIVDNSSPWQLQHYWP